ncbi:MAG: DNA polymerase I [Spirochaetia bacterium]|nr:DNA polymerase I [Spirochaetia bacterium]
MKTFYIIDGNSYAYRAFYAMPPLTGPDGAEVHAVYGFYAMVMRVIRDKKPDCLAITFDHPKPTFRHKMFADYKAQREKMPESLQGQMKVIKETAAHSGFAVFEREGYEADDIIAALARQAAGEKYRVYIITGDKDLMQLVDKNISILKFKGKEETVLTPEKIREDMGIEPAEIADVLALMGDAADNIPGVDGIGEKSAYRLIQQFKSIENIYEKLDGFKPGRQKELLLAGKESAKISKELAVLNTDKHLMEMCSDLKPCELSAIDFVALNDHFVHFNFRSLVFEKTTEKKTASADIRTAAYGGTVRIKSLQEMASEIKRAGKVTVIFEYDDEGPEMAAVRAGGTSYLLPERPGTIELEGVEVLTNDSKTVHKLSAGTARRVDDVMLLAWLCNPEKNFRDISHAASEYLGGVYGAYEDAVGKGVKKIKPQEADTAALDNYAVQSIGLAEKLEAELSGRIEKEGLEKVYSTIEMPLSAVLAKMEMTGLKIDSKFLDELVEKTGAKIAAAEKRIYSGAGGEFNINSPKQLGEVLFERLKLPAQRKTRTGYSTDSEVLSNLEHMNPVVAEIINYRTLNKLKTGFLDSIKEKLTGDSMLYPTYNQNATSTGRLSSSNPNIQNIPVRGEEGREIRKIFTAFSKKEVLIKADYSQIELRVLAHMCGDEKLIEIFRNNGDIHALTASEIFGLPPEFLTKDHRRAAKTINFGIIYGISPYGLSKQLGVPVGEASAYMDRFFATFPGVREYQDRTIKEAAKNGYVETLCGRRRYMADINSKNRTIREFAERAAINAPIQGTAADIIKLAMIAVNNEFEKKAYGAKMILQVHDELVFTVPKQETAAVKGTVAGIMESALKLKVPLKADFGEGQNWYECG